MLAAALVVCMACLPSCARTSNADAVEEIPRPMAWPANPLLPCRARIGYANEFLDLAKQGLPEQRIVIAEDWEPAEERAEILEIRRRAYHDQDALAEVVECARRGANI